MTQFVLPKPDGSGWGVYESRTKTWWPGTWSDEEEAVRQLEKELVRPLRDRIWAWIRATPRGTIGEGAKHFGLTPTQFLAARDARRKS